jgi:hypothetical protein
MPSFEKFLARTKRTKADLLRDLDLDPKSSLISAYVSGRAMPSYEMCVKLLDCGMTVEELFGPEIWAQAKAQALMESGDMDRLSDVQCRRIVEIGLSALRREGKEP